MEDWIVHCKGRCVSKCVWREGAKAGAVSQEGKHL